MTFEDISPDQKDIYNLSVNHPLQTFEWGLFRKKTGVEIIRKGIVKRDKILNPYQISVHKTPKFPYRIGYFPKGQLPSKELLDELKNIGSEQRISFIQLEPNVINHQSSIINYGLRPSFHPLFTRFTFILDLKKTEEELLKNMHQKTRYNIRVAEKKGAETHIDNSDSAFSDYLRLTKQTTKRQKFYAHDERYHRLMWETLKSQQPEASSQKPDPNRLQAHLLTTKYKQKTLVAYILFTFKDTLYYPYGVSSEEYREVMASHSAMWGAILFGKSLGLSKFDMWGAANAPDPKENDPYFGFHRFKKGFGGELVEFIGSYDLVVNPINYRLLTVADKIRWLYFRTKKFNPKS